MIDLHCHLVPGVDDGASNLEESRAALQLLHDQGVRGIVATPHLDGSTTLSPERTEIYFERLAPAWDELRTASAEVLPDLRLERGTEVMLDTPAPDLSDPRVRLAGTDFVLVEFPYLNIPPQSVEAIYELRLRGWTPVIAHPERYAGMDRKLPLLEEWKRVGGLLQVNCGSLLGRYGETAEAMAWRLLKAGLADYLASDYHGRGRYAVSECREALDRFGGDEQLQLLMVENPSRLLEGRAPRAVPPLPRRSLWKRLFGEFGE